MVKADFVDGTSGILFVGVTCEQQTHRVRLEAPNLLQKIDAVHLRHQKIGNDHVQAPALQILEGPPGVIRVDNVVVGL